MEERKMQVSTYLRTIVSPFFAPLMEQLAKKRPKDLLAYTKAYIDKLFDERDQQQTHSDSDYTDQNQAEVNRKFEERLRQKKNQKKITTQEVSAEVYGLFNQKPEFGPKMIQKPSQVKTSIRELLKKSMLFVNLSDEDLNIVIDAMSVQEFKKGQQIFREGDEGQTFYVVGSGEYDCSKVVYGAQTYLKTYRSGEYFGELALMHPAPRAASLVCSKSGVLYGLDRRTFRYIVEEEVSKRRQKYEKILSKVSILSKMDPYERDRLCDILIEKTYNAGEYIVREGQEGDKFYMVVYGKLIAEKQSKKVFEFKEGDYFGEISLVRNSPRQASIRCLIPTKVIYVQRDAFKRMFGPIEEMFKRNEEKYKQYISD